MIQGYIITADHEKARAENVQSLLKQLPGIKKAKAIYPDLDRVPFCDQILLKSRARSGRPFMKGEMGVLLSNRRIWMEIQHHSQEQEHFLILESDSHLNDPAFLKEKFQELTQGVDLFFWGAWLGHMVLQKSTRKKLESGYQVGTPLLRSVSGAYGYSLNKKAAKHLLERTGKMMYEVDEFKRYIDPDLLKLGGISPELISQGPGESLIDKENQAARINRTWIKLLTVRNKIIAHFS